MNNSGLNYIWQNIWLNKVQSAYSVKERKKYLIDQGVAFDSQSKKVIKQLFLNEMRHVADFDIKNWFKEQITESLWFSLYEEARQKAIEREIKKEHDRKQQLAKDKIYETVQFTLEKLYIPLYTYIRFRTAQQLFMDLKEKQKFKLVGQNRRNEHLVQDGHFSVFKYKLLRNFFDEFTGSYIEEFYRGRLYYDFETYGNLYYDHIHSFIYDGIKMIFHHVFQKEFHQYEEITGTTLKLKKFLRMLSPLISDLADEYFQLLNNEYIEDLLSLTDIPYTTETHIELLKKHEKLQEERRKQEELERKRRIERENRMIADVFGGTITPKENNAVKYILHIGETNTGKTYHALEKMKRAESGCYLAPLRLLALEVYENLNANGVPCNLKTGEEEKINPDAKHIACTVEMYSEKDEYDCIVIDEAQMIADQERGFSWYRAITGANAKEVHIIGSQNCKQMLLGLLEGAEIHLKEYKRDTPLEVEEKRFSIEDIKKGDALICFSRRKVLETASFLQRKGKKVSMIYGSMPPETRKKQIEQFINGVTSIIVATDAIGMGLNLPIRRIVFLENEKFDGTRRRRLTSQEVKQIAGRAGRKGIYDVGKVAFTNNVKQMKALLEKEDEPLKTFTIAPTNAMFERFQKYSRHLGTFFDLWEKYKSPKGTVKAPLTQEKELYQLIQGTELEARLSMMDLYGFLHLPFSSSEKTLVQQWLKYMEAIVNNEELPEPYMKSGSLDEVELSYKSIGLHLLFLYRLGRKTETYYWERLRKEMSDEANDFLRSEIKAYKKKCKRCGRKLPYNHEYKICDHCYHKRMFVY